MRYVIIGAGGVGGVVGARLHRTGHDVVFVARGEHLRAIRERGLRLVTPDDDETDDIPAFARIDEVGLRSDDLVVLAVKGQDTAGVLDQLAAAAPPNLAVACLQNGVENERLALRRFADVYAICVILPGANYEPGIVLQYSTPVPGILDVGRYPHGIDDRVTTMVEDFTAAGFRSEADPAIMRRKYRKLLANLPNAIDALCGPDARRSPLAEGARAEGRAVLAAAGIELQSEEDEAARRDGARLLVPIEGQPDYGTSSTQSLARRTGSIEADHLNGEIVLLGRRHGVPTPINELLQREANAAAREGRPPASLTVEELAARL